MDTNRPTAAQSAQRVPVLTAVQIIQICKLAESMAKARGHFCTQLDSATRMGVPLSVQRQPSDRAKQRLFDYLKGL